MFPLLLIASIVLVCAHTHAQTLHVSAAASLRETFVAISHSFEKAHPGVEVELNFAGSQQLAAQISQGEECDVFASADERTIRELRLAAPGPRPFARNSLVMVTAQPKLRLNLRGLASVSSLIVAAPQVPAGGYTVQMLAAASKAYGHDWLLQVQRKIVSQEQDVRAVLAKVELKEADAGVVYATDAKSAKGKVAAFPVDRRFQPSVVYPIGVLADSTQSSLAQSFVAYVLAKPGQSILRSAGFLSAGPPTQSK